jgi:hypothetical protein
MIFNIIKLIHKYIINNDNILINYSTNIYNHLKREKNIVIQTNRIICINIYQSNEMFELDQI